MSSNKDAMKNILLVALSVCFVCSVVVSGAAVSLKPERLANKELDRNKNILIAAGLFEKGVTQDSEVEGLFKSFEIGIVDLQEQRLLTADEVEQTKINFDRYDQRKAAKDPTMSVALNTVEDMLAEPTDLRNKQKELQDILSDAGFSSAEFVVIFTDLSPAVKDEDE